MQKVVWPMMIVQIDSSMFTNVNEDRSAIAVMMPGSASGSTSRKLTASLPKKLVRWIANAASEPSTSEAAVVTRAMRTERPIAEMTSGSLSVRLIQLKVSDDGGHA